MPLAYLAPLWCLLQTGIRLYGGAPHVIYPTTAPIELVQNLRPEMEVIRLRPDRFLTNRQKTIPAFHELTPFHYQRYLDSRYSSFFSYSDFCLLEEQMADLTTAYLHDDSRHWIVQIDPVFLGPDGVKSYLDSLTARQAVWFTPVYEPGISDFVVWRLPNETPLM